MEHFSEQRADFVLTTDKSLLCNKRMCEMLKETHWASLRPREVVDVSVGNSLVFGILQNGVQVAMARVVTDYASFAWVCDVVVEQRFQGLGLGRWLMEAIEVHPALSKVRRYLLCTRTAKGLYAKLGYEALPNDETTWMIRLFPEREQRQRVSQEKSHEP